MLHMWRGVPWCQRMILISTRSTIAPHSTGRRQKLRVAPHFLPDNVIPHKLYTMVAAKLTNARLIGGRKALPSVLNRGRGVASTQVAAEANTPEVKSATGKAKIYIGKGRFLEDDPTKYPDRTVLTGGFAGGEVRASVDFT